MVENSNFLIGHVVSILKVRERELVTYRKWLTRQRGPVGFLFCFDVLLGRWLSQDAVFLSLTLGHGVHIFFHS